MPTYNYHCAQCDVVFEVFHSMKDESPHLCPGCGAEAKKLLSAPPIIYRGSGFYTTDYCKHNLVSSPPEKKTPSPNDSSKKT